MTPLVNPRGLEAFGRRNLVLTGHGSRHTPIVEYAGPLSLKGVLQGQIDWRTPERLFRVFPDTFVLLNRDQRYALSTEAEGRCKTFCVFFEDGFVEHAVHQLLATTDELLEDCTAAPQFGFFERITPISSDCGAALAALAKAVARRVPEMELELMIHHLAIRVAHTAIGERRRPDRLSSVRPATRAEIYRRLMRFRSMMEDDLSAKWTLKAMGAAAAMAPHHFARCFHQCFGETPRAFLMRRRFERARVLLNAGELTVTQVCLEVGYESPASFSTAYRARYGEPPSKTLAERAYPSAERRMTTASGGAAERVQAKAFGKTSGAR